MVSSEGRQAADAALLVVKEKLASLHPCVTRATTDLAAAARVSQTRHNNVFDKQLGATQAVAACIKAEASLCIAYASSRDAHAAAMEYSRRASELKRCDDCSPADAAAAVTTAVGFVRITSTKTRQLRSQCQKLAKLTSIAQRNERDWFELTRKSLPEPEATRQFKRRKTSTGAPVPPEKPSPVPGNTDDETTVFRKAPLADLLYHLESRPVSLDAALLETQREIPPNEPCVAALDFSSIFHSSYLAARDVACILAYFLDDQNAELRVNAFTCVFSSLVTSYLHRFCPANRFFLTGLFLWKALMIS
jgi:hypothetical protein